MATKFTDSLNNDMKENKDEKLDEKLNDSLDHSQDHSLVFSIPNKTIDKTDTQGFNVVMKKSLVLKLDKLGKKKGGYSRNELINYMCQWCIDNMED